MNEKKTDTVVLDNSERQPCEVWPRVNHSMSGRKANLPNASISKKASAA